MSKFLYVFMLFVFLSSCKTNRTVVLSELAPKPIGPYSQAVLVSNTLYISGQIGINPETGQLDSTGIEGECRQALNNMGSILKAAGMNFGNVVKVSIFIKKMSDFEKVNKIYKEFFNEPFPARETIGVAELPKNALIEISAVALK